MLLPFAQDTEAHLQQEEQVLLPALQKQLSRQQLMDLGRQFEWAKLIAPSRCVCASCNILLPHTRLMPPVLSHCPDMWLFVSGLLQAPPLGTKGMVAVECPGQRHAYTPGLCEGPVGLQRCTHAVNA